MNELELTGRARTHIIELDQPRCALHYAVATSWLAMRDAAARAGIDLVPASSFRDFDRQVLLWNRKWQGERPLHDRSGRPLDYAALSEAARVDAILCWSAVPGGSRHHWGTDLDVIDAAALPPDYKVQLLPAEYAPDGVFARLGAWLDENMHRYGFYRPSGADRGGVGGAPWHLS
jgi:LAS superfamily LD-carboxypeptidase LdcB